MKTLWTVISIGIVLFITGCDCEDDKDPCTDSDIIRIVSTITHGMNPIEDSLTLVPGKVFYNHSCLKSNPKSEISEMPSLVIVKIKLINAT